MEVDALSDGRVPDARGRVSARVRFEVPFHDCDPLQIVWHGRYFQYFEIARAALFRGRGLDVPEIRELGYRMVVSDVRCRFLSPLTYGDEVEVVATVKAATPLIRVVYSVTNKTRGRRSARGYCVLASTDFNGDFLPETPEAIRARLID